eukprot:COSAG06_NODE_8064_length_2284_cov_11.298783_3_plen_142_part_01
MKKSHGSKMSFAAPSTLPQVSRKRPRDDYDEQLREYRVRARQRHTKTLDLASTADALARGFEQMDQETFDGLTQQAQAEADEEMLIDYMDDLDDDEKQERQHRPGALKKLEPRHARERGSFHAVDLTTTLQHPYYQGEEDNM